MLVAPLLCGLQLPAPLRPSRSSAVPVIVGGDTANVLFGKIQRAATLPGSKLSPNPVAAVDDLGRLGKVLWSQYMMSSVPSSDAISRDELERSPRMAESLLFIDCTMSVAGGGLPNPFSGLFGNKIEPQAGRAPDPMLLSLAAARSATHVYVMVDGGESGGTAALQEYARTLEESGLTATLIAPEDGVTLQSTPGWVCGQLQDHEGEVQSPLAVRSGIAPSTTTDSDSEAPPPSPQLLPSPAASAAQALPREDFAELVLQYALRCARGSDEGAPPLRVVRVAPAQGGGLTERAVMHYDAVIGGPKTRKRLGTVQSADWGALLAPFGVVRESSADDWRVLVEVISDVEQPVYKQRERAK